MRTRELSKMLKDSLQLQEELVEMVEECLKYIYENEDDRRIAINNFHEDIECMHFNGCLQGLRTINQRVLECRSNREKKAAL